MNPIIALCDFTAYPALIAEKIYLNEKLNQIKEDLKSFESVSAVQYDKEPCQNHTSQSSIMNEILTEEQETTEEIERVLRRIEETESLFKKLPEQERTFVKEKYFFSRTWQDMARLFNMSPGAIDYHIRKAIERM